MKWIERLLPIWVLLLVSLTYANHFGNGFHFDDIHTVVRNPAIRSLSNIPKFFVDAKLFSIFPPNQTYRPLTTATLAVDYALGKGLDPFYFHVTTFALFLVQLLAMGALFTKLVGNRVQAWLAVAAYGLHPVGAETINYVIQRADMFVALGLSAGMLLYVHKFYRLAWVVFGLGCLAKPSGVVFAGLVVAYEYFLGGRNYRRSIPYVLLAGGLALLTTSMQPSTNVVGATSDAYKYRLTQAYIAATYLREAVAPFHLAADSEFPPFENILEPLAVLGYVVVAALVYIIFRGRRPVVSFGLSWFLMAMAPTSLTPLGDVTNDHRMFGPFVGLALCLATLLRTRFSRYLVLFALPLLAYGTTLRNEVWGDEEKLWRDAVVKRPQNGRAWLNLGVCLLTTHRPSEALAAMLEAKKLNESYVYLEVNLGMAYAELGRLEKAEHHLLRATQVDPGGTPLYLYGNFLAKGNRLKEAIPILYESNQRNPMDKKAIRLLHSLYDRQYAVCKGNPTVGNYSDFCLYLILGHEYGKAAEMAEKAVKLDPSSSSAWANQATAYLALKRWSDAESSARRALKLQPGMKSAQRTLEQAQNRNGAGPEKKI
jgi:tetratricopeptide (TPR) repeat protein